MAATRPPPLLAIMIRGHPDVQWNAEFGLESEEEKERGPWHSVWYVEGGEQPYGGRKYAVRRMSGYRI